MSKNVKKRRKRRRRICMGQIVNICSRSPRTAVAAVGYAAYQDHCEREEAKKFYEKRQNPSSSSSTNMTAQTPKEEEPKKKCNVCACDIVGLDLQKLPCSCNMHEKCFENQGKLCTIAEHK